MPAHPLTSIAPSLAELTIRAIGARGDGITETGAFVALTLPDERVRARLTEGRGDLAEILIASVDRVAPPCPHFGECGGCALQHWRSEPYLAWKIEQVRSVLAWARIETDVSLAFAAAPGARRRLALHARRRGREIVLGFKARRSWDVKAIDSCAIADPRIVAALPALRVLAAPFLEHPKSAPILHVTLTQTGLDIDVTGVERKGGGLSADARARAARAAAAADVARVTLAGELVYQARAPIVRIGPASVALPPGAFLQADPGAEAAMADLVLEAAAGAHRIADLFCGVGTFTFRLAAIAPVLAADAADGAISALKSAIAGAPGLKAIDAQTRDLDRRPILAEEMKKIDVAVFDPPRAGADAQARQLAASKVARVVGVSCNPATFARDARTLIDGGFELRRVAVVDQFLWSPHIELVSVFSR